MPTVAEVIAGTAAAVEQDPANAKATVRTSGSLTGPVEVTLRSGDRTVVVDEPEQLAGANAGPSPLDLALLSLASCQAITYRFWAEHLGMELDDVEVKVEADIDLRGFFGLDDDVRAGFSGVRVEVTPKGPESAERYQELADAVDAHCPVLDLFAGGTQIERNVAVPA